MCLKLGRAARILGLSVELGEIIMLGGNIYVTIQGRLRKAHETGQFRGFLDVKLPRDEWADYDIPDDAVSAWKCSVFKDGYEHPFIEVGWAGGKRDERQPVAKAFPGEMSRKRARARSLSLGFPLGLPSIEELTGEEIPEELFNKAVLAATVDATGPIKQPRRVGETQKAAPAQQSNPAAPASPAHDQNASLDFAAFTVAMNKIGSNLTEAADACDAIFGHRDLAKLTREQGKRIYDEIKNSQKPLETPVPAAQGQAEFV
jgi:hypothetical protein